jgi:sugar phosphate isomerase/epimerase
MIFISSSCIKANKISDSVEALAAAGFNNIELSGGTKFYPEYESDLDDLKNEYGLNYRCHNYFPPPKIPFVLNLASVDENALRSTTENLKETIRLTRKYGGRKIGIHAGFYIGIKNIELGKKIARREMVDKIQADQIFYKSFSEIQNLAPDIEFYIENNVVSLENYKAYGGKNAFMLTESGDHLEMTKHIKFKPLFDVAHLQVSCNTLSLDYEEQFKYFITRSDYIHLSDNNSISDQNMTISPTGQIIKLLRNSDLKNKDFTLEIYSGVSEIEKAYSLIEEYAND